jgi:hypothetical protein
MSSPRRTMRVQPSRGRKAIPVSFGSSRRPQLGRDNDVTTGDHTRRLDACRKRVVGSPTHLAPHSIVVEGHPRSCPTSEVLSAVQHDLERRDHQTRRVRLRSLSAHGWL